MSRVAQREAILPGVQDTDKVEVYDVPSRSSVKCLNSRTAVRSSSKSV